jgi:hypothetical protein
MVTAFTGRPIAEDASRLSSLETPVAAGRLLRMALTLGWSLRQTAECVAELEPLGIEMPSRTWRDIHETWLQPSDTVVLSTQLNGRAPWCGAEIQLGHVFAASDKLGELPSETVRRLRWYEAWGVGIPMAVARIDQFRPSETELRALSVSGDGRWPWHGRTIRGHQVWRTAAGMGIARASS